MGRVSGRQKKAEASSSSGASSPETPVGVQAPMLAETPVKVLEPKPSLRLSAYGSTEELHTQVLDLAGNSDLDVDLSEMTNLDASALQVLLALAGEQAACGLQLQMRNVSPALGQWLESTGAAQHLPASAQEERG